MTFVLYPINTHSAFDSPPAHGNILMKQHVSGEADELIGVN